MNRHIHKLTRGQPRPSWQHGFGLIEIMITLLIASFLAIAIATVFLSGRSSFLSQEQVGRLQENARYAFQLMSNELHRAGYRPEVWEPPALGFAFTNNTLDGSGALPDSIELQYESDRDCNYVLNSNTESVKQPPDGNLIVVPQHYEKRVSFSVDNEQLVYTCSYGPINGTLVQEVNAEVADGVENLQLQYGEDLTGDHSVNQWVDAGNWNALSGVVAVRIALLVRTPEEFLSETDTETFDLYSVTTAAADDRRVRRIYSGQVSIRNLTL